MKKSVIVLIFSLLFSQFSLGKETTSISTLKDKLNNQMSVLATLGAEIRSIEDQLGKKNDDYLAKAKEIQRLETHVSQMKENLAASAQEISKNYATTKKILNHYLLDISDEKSQDRLLKKKIYIKLLQNKIKDLQEAQASSHSLLGTVKDYEQRLDESKKDEGALYRLLVDLEDKKKELGQKYVSSLELKNDYEENLEQAIARRQVKKTRRKVSHSNIDVQLRKPLDHYEGLKGSKKGVTFKYTKVSPVYASGSGKIVYAGELASYGKVIMVDHGKEIRSVILGDIAIKVRKGDMVRKGEILAYTNSDPGLTKSLYYEVRKKNIAQNTLNILKKSNKNI